MSAEENKTIVHRYIEEVVNKGSMAVADELIATNVVLHIAGLPEPIRADLTLSSQLSPASALPSLTYT
jgi:hypothetical protein